MKHRVHPLIGTLLILAVVGLALSLWENPVTILVVIGLSAFVLFLLNNYVKSGRFLPQLQKPKPKQPAKSAKAGIRKSGHSPRRDHPFRVIEGSKGKSKGETQKKETKMNH